MMTIKMKDKKGFTIVEALSVSVILLFVLMAVFSSYVMLSQYVRDTTAQTAVQSEARLAIDRMARNIRLASDVNCPAAGTSIDLTFDPGKMGQAGSSWTARYRLAGNQVLFVPNINSTNETVILDDVVLNPGQILFQYDGAKKLVTIDLNVENASITTTQYTPLTTAIKAKNVP